MNVFFVIPDIKGVLARPTSPHVGTAYLAAVLLKNNHKVKILDMRLGYDEHNLLKELKEFNPDLVCVTCVSMHYKHTYYLINKIKENNFKVCVGGPHVSTTKTKILEQCKADFAVKGEAEETLVEICENKSLKDLKGVIWRDNTQIIENEDRPLIHDLNKLPFPAFQLFELDQYIDKKLPIVSSRGCPYGCTYCSIKLTMGRGFRPRSAENVVNELEHWNKQYNYTYFGINDDCFSLDLDRAKRICDLIIERNLKIKWEIRNGIRVDRVDEELLTKMKKAGCFYIAFGVESANQDVIDKMKKSITPEKAKEAILLANKVGIKKGAFFIIGLPGEDFNKFKNSLRFALSLPLDELRFYNPIPFPGTELMEWVKTNGKFIIEPETYLNEIGSLDNQPIFETDNFPIAQRKKAYNIAESYVMKYLMKSEFGPFIGTIGWIVWKPKLTRKFIFEYGKKLWSLKRKFAK
jgi:radical SAM superfamily enzyme YgiQ (UPF0313 family)